MEFLAFISCGERRTSESARRISALTREPLDYRLSLRVEVAKIILRGQTVLSPIATGNRCRRLSEALSGDAHSWSLPKAFVEGARWSQRLPHRGTLPASLTMIVLTTAPCSIGSQGFDSPLNEQ